MIRLRLILLLLGAFLVSAVRADAPALERKTVLKGKVSLLLPKGFKPMKEALLKIKYPSQQRPTLVYANARGSVSIALNHTQNRMPANELPAFHKYLENTVKQAHPQSTWFRSEMVKINGRPFFLMEFHSPAVDTTVRNLMVGTSLDNRLLIVACNVTQELEKDWTRTHHQIVNSIRIVPARAGAAR